jgi:hypothetical protein
LAESQLWRAALDSERSATMAAVFELAGVVASAETMMRVALVSTEQFAVAVEETATEPHVAISARAPGGDEGYDVPKKVRRSR